MTSCRHLIATTRPQEAGAYQPSVRPGRRREIAAELNATAPDAFQLLANCLAQAGEQPAEELVLPVQPGSSVRPAPARLAAWVSCLWRPLLASAAGSSPAETPCLPYCKCVGDLFPVWVQGRAPW